MNAQYLKVNLLLGLLNAREDIFALFPMAREAITNTELEIPVLLGAFGMMCRGEICALNMNDINGTTIHIHHSLVLGHDNKWHLKAPKTESSDRYVEIPQFVVDRIREKGHITKINPQSI